MPSFSGCICVPRWVVCKSGFKNHLAAALHAGSVEHPDLYGADWVFGSRRCRPVWVAWLTVDGHCAMFCYMQGKLTNTISFIMAAVTLSTSHACVCVSVRQMVRTNSRVCDCVSVFLRCQHRVFCLSWFALSGDTQVLTAMITAQLSDTLKTWKNMFFFMFS